MASDSETVCTVFIVEDSQIIVGRIQDLLDEIDMVRFLGNAPSIKSAMEILACESPDAMILDINLGENYPINGIQFMMMIRDEYPALKIIMLTNHSDAHYRKLCEDGGADYFFDKSHEYDSIPEILINIAIKKRA